MKNTWSQLFIGNQTATGMSDTATANRPPNTTGIESPEGVTQQSSAGGSQEP